MLGLIGGACVFVAAGFAIGGGKSGAALALILGGFAAVAGIGVSVLGVRGTTVRNVIGTLSFVINALVLAFVVGFAMLFRW